MIFAKKFNIFLRKNFRFSKTFPQTSKTIPLLMLRLTGEIWGPVDNRIYIDILKFRDLTHELVTDPMSGTSDDFLQ